MVRQTKPKNALRRSLVTSVRVFPIPHLLLQYLSTGFRLAETYLMKFVLQALDRIFCLILDHLSKEP